MNCPKCGMSLPDDSDFCQYCGAKIEHPSSAHKQAEANAVKKCAKCGMELPVDSDYCQYCGEKISPPPEEPKLETPEEGSISPVISMLAGSMAENIVANRRLLKKHTSDSDYGLVPQKPVFTFMVDGAQTYLDGLVSENNEELTWQRTGSMPVEGIAGPVDIYVSRKESGEQYKTLYVSIYAESNSRAIPKGFLRKGASTKAVPSKTNASTGSNALKETKRSPLRIVLIVLSIICILLLSALNIIQYVTHKNDLERISAAESSNEDMREKLAEQEANNNSNNKKIEELDAEIASKDATIAEKNKTIQSQEKTISSQNSKISSLEKKADYYSTISSALKSGNIGYAASNFNCSQSIILVKKGETKKVTLTANWSNGGTVSLSFSSYAADVDFDQDSWSYSTTLSIKGLSSGVTVVTFSNNVDSRTFKIIIIVE